MTLKAQSHGPGQWQVVNTDQAKQGAVGTIYKGSTPALPASGVSVTNSNFWPEQITINGGTVSQVQINGGVTGRTSGSFSLPQGSSIIITYSVAPTWSWYSDGRFYSIVQKMMVATPKNSLRDALRVFELKENS
jgi:hypothetical protein